jgi:hypothetical protein
MLRTLAVSVLVSAVVSLLGGCGDDDNGSGSSSRCDDVCACVVASGGDRATCHNECAATESAGGNMKLSCELKLDGWGYPQCKPKCAAFPTG